MKLKYQKLSKEEKNEVIKNFKNSDLGKQNKFRLIRILIIGIFSIIYSFYCLYEYMNTNNIGYLIFGITCILAGILLIVGYIKVRLKLLNAIAIKK